MKPKMQVGGLPVIIPRSRNSLQYVDYLFGVEDSTGGVQGRVFKKGVVGERNVHSPLTAKWKTPTRHRSLESDALGSNLNIRGQNKWRGFI